MGIRSYYNPGLPVRELLVDIATRYKDSPEQLVEEFLDACSICLCSSCNDFIDEDQEKLIPRCSDCIAKNV